MKNGEFVGNIERIFYSSYVSLSVEKSMLNVDCTVDYHEDYQLVKINFCPMCGEDLNMTNQI